MSRPTHITVSAEQIVEWANAAIRARALPSSLQDVADEVSLGEVTSPREGPRGIWQWDLTLNDTRANEEATP